MEKDGKEQMEEEEGASRVERHTALESKHGATRSPFLIKLAAARSCTDVPLFFWC